MKVKKRGGTGHFGLFRQHASRTRVIKLAANRWRLRKRYRALGFQDSQSPWWYRFSVGKRKAA